MTLSCFQLSLFFHLSTSANYSWYGGVNWFCKVRKKKLLSLLLLPSLVIQSSCLAFGRFICQETYRIYLHTYNVWEEHIRKGRNAKKCSFLGTATKNHEKICNWAQRRRIAKPVLNQIFFSKNIRISLMHHFFACLSGLNPTHSWT